MKKLASILIVIGVIGAIIGIIVYILKKGKNISPTLGHETGLNNSAANNYQPPVGQSITDMSAVDKANYKAAIIKQMGKNSLSKGPIKVATNTVTTLSNEKVSESVRNAPVTSTEIQRDLLQKKANEAIAKNKEKMSNPNSKPPQTNIQKANIKPATKNINPNLNNKF